MILGNESTSRTPSGYKVAPMSYAKLEDVAERLPERGGEEFMHVAAPDGTACTRVEGLLRKVREFFQGHESSFGVPRRIGSDARA